MSWKRILHASKLDMWLCSTISRTVRSPSIISSSRCSGLARRSTPRGVDGHGVLLEDGLEVAEARLDEAPLVDAAEALHDHRRDGQRQPRALGERGERLAPELEAAARPAQHLVHELARLPRERVAELLARDATRVDEHVPEQARATALDLVARRRASASGGGGRGVGALSRSRRSMSSGVTRPCSTK